MTKVKELIKKLLGIDKVYERKYRGAYSADLFMAAVLGFFVYVLLKDNASQQVARIVTYGVVLVVVFVVVRKLAQTLYVSWLISRRDYKNNPETSIDSVIRKSAISDELEGVDTARLIHEANNWKLYDATFDFYRKTKHGSYKSRQAYYTIFEIKLATFVPHLIFDSLVGKRSQFKKIYLQAQRVSLEGNFDDYFEVYAPQSYHLDALSFITPEVMEAMIEVGEFDIEFQGDSLLVFAPLLPASQIKHFKQRCLRLHRHVNDNLMTYRDNRTAAEPHNSVTDFGKRLLNNPARYVPTALMSGVGITVLVLLAIQARNLEFLINEVAVAAYVFFFGALSKIIKTHRENTKLEAQFRAKYKQHHS